MEPGLSLARHTTKAGVAVAWASLPAVSPDPPDHMTREYYRFFCSSSVSGYHCKTIEKFPTFESLASR